MPARPRPSSAPFPGLQTPPSRRWADRAAGPRTPGTSPRLYPPPHPQVPSAASGPPGTARSPPGRSLPDPSLPGRSRRRKPPPAAAAPAPPPVQFPPPGRWSRQPERTPTEFPPGLPLSAVFSSLLSLQPSLFLPSRIFSRLRRSRFPGRITAAASPGILQTGRRRIHFHAAAPCFNLHRRYIPFYNSLLTRPPGQSGFP